MCLVALVALRDYSASVEDVSTTVVGLCSSPWMESETPVKKLGSRPIC